MKLLVINGPNINLLGVREKEIYGTKTYQDLETFIKDASDALGVLVEIHQTNLEGIIIDLLHYAHFKAMDGVILNAAAYTHYSYAIRDAIKAINVPVIEVHLSDIKTRKEPFRHLSVIESVCEKTFSGKGFESYLEAIHYLVKK
jgi:3-dehydroquinate dehydratase-2